MAWVSKCSWPKKTWSRPDLEKASVLNFVFSWQSESVLSRKEGYSWKVFMVREWPLSAGSTCRKSGCVMAVNLRNEGD